MANLLRRCLPRLLQNLEARQQPSALAKRKKKDIPIPVILSVPSYDAAVSDDFAIPTSYVRFQALPRDISSSPTTADAAASSSSSEAAPVEPQAVEVDLDLADMRWLRRHPKYGADGDPRYQLSLERFAQMLDALEKASALLNPNVMTLAEAEDVFAKRLDMHKTPLNRVTSDVYAYWAAKRQQLRRPLLRRFWPQTPLNDTNPHLVFRPREKERYKLRKHRKNDLDGFHKLQQLRVDFERVRRLLDLVRRRERAKRLQLDFLDEIRLQAEHELTNRGADAVVRKPVIPVDEERERHKKRKKKKKKHRDSESGNGSSVGDTAAGALSQSAAGEAKTGTDAKTGKTQTATGARIEGPQMAPTFMEYDTSANFAMEDTVTDTDSSPREGSGSAYPSYPLSTPQLMAAIFQQPPKYRCRGRIGRGGRLVIDRIPVPSSRYYSSTETTAPSLKPSVSAVSGVGTTLTAPGSAVAAAPVANAELGVASIHHGSILVQELAVRPLSNKIEHVTSKRLDEIYGMSDSEDELLEPLSSSVYETPSTRKASGGGKGHQHAHPTPARKVKFTLDV
ncbi:hypothetical protein BBJ28_00016415 [Nothophytophthora sp. Chile5]|nr:hypothetical protein BBJ28_00016415 [Nothophytophthora sp. Chile5]